MAEANGEQRYKITEVCRLADVQPYVLRYWESEFTALAPDRTIPGPRTYSARDLKVVERIKKLLYDEGYTIAGAKKRLEGELKADEGAGGVPIAAVPASEVTTSIPGPGPLPPKPRSRKAAAQAQPALADLMLDEVVKPIPEPPPIPVEPKPEPQKSADSAAPMVLHVADPRVAVAVAELKAIRDLLAATAAAS